MCVCARACACRCTYTCMHVYVYVHDIFLINVHCIREYCVGHFSHCGSTACCHHHNTAHLLYMHLSLCLLKEPRLWKITYDVMVHVNNVCHICLSTPPSSSSENFSKISKILMTINGTAPVIRSFVSRLCS